MNLTKQMAYLKHVGKLQNAKVTIRCEKGHPEIYIHDFIFHTFEDALYYLKRDATTVILDHTVDVKEII